MNKKSVSLKRRLGRTGFEVNILGLGGHTYQVGDSPHCLLTPEARSQLISRLVSSGVNYFDTTAVQEVEVLADSFRRADIKQNVLVSLHGGRILDAQWSERLRPGIEARLDILGYSRAPLFISNVGDGDATYADIAAACETMTKLKDEKLVQNIGLSCHTPSLFPMISKLIRETDVIDYIMVRFNWKCQQANEGLFPVAEEHDVGIVVMKIFCWDCDPSQWERRISVFEPIAGQNRIEDSSSPTPAQRNILWCVQNSRCDVVVPSMNTMREVEENIEALKWIDMKVSTDNFEKYGNRLWDKKEIKMLAMYAENKVIRERAESLLNPKRTLPHILIRIIKTHYRILKNEGIRKYLLYSYHYRKEQLFSRLRKSRA